MSDKSKNIFGIIFNVILAMYPILLFYFMIIQNFPLKIFSLFIIALALFEIIVKIYKIKRNKIHSWYLWNSLLFLVVGVLCFITNTNIAIKLSPILMNIIFLFTFGTTLFQPPTMIYRFAVLVDKTIQNSPAEKKIAAYCYKVTVIWCVFFVLNGSIAALTVISGSDLIWAIYNCGVSYVLAGILFVGEFIVRKFVQKKMSKAVPPASLPEDR